MFKKTKSRRGFWTGVPVLPARIAQLGSCGEGDSNHSFVTSFSGTSPPICECSDLASERSLVTAHRLAQILFPATATASLTPLRGFLPGCSFPSPSCGLGLGSATSLPGKPWQVLFVSVCSPSRKKSVALMSAVKILQSLLRRMLLHKGFRNGSCRTVVRNV